VRLRERLLGERPLRRELTTLFIVALALRLAAIIALDTTHSSEVLSVWMWGREPACLAEAIARGDGFADPFGKGTGASGWLTPVYPAVLALLMWVFDGLNESVALALFVVQGLVSALTCVLLVRFGRALGLGLTGRLAGWAFAFYPLAIWNSINKVWDTTFVACGLLLFLVHLIESGRAPSSRRTAKLGLGYGALLMLNPAPLGISPAILAYLAVGADRRAALRRIGIFSGMTVLVCLPWMIRNRVQLGTFGLRSNLGVELYVGNNDVANGRHQTPYHPSQTKRETERLRAAGEVDYAHEVLWEAVDWIEHNPVRFARLTLRRMQIFWIGESPNVDPRVSGGVKAADDPNAWIKWPLHLVTGLLGIVGAFVVLRRSAEGWLLRGALILFPIPYYLTHVAERYRFPIDPLLVFLDVALLVWLARRWRERGGSDAH